MDMPPEASRSSSLDVTIEQLRYWVPTIKDVAHAETACPVALTLKGTGGFDLVIAGERYADCALDSSDQIVPLLERIVDGDVVQRRWISVATGAHQGVETLVRLGDGLLWRDGPEPDGGALRRDRHFLPYRRP